LPGERGKAAWGRQTCAQGQHTHTFSSMTLNIDKPSAREDGIIEVGRKVKV
jgi:hypothetical protein